MGDGSEITIDNKEVNRLKLIVVGNDIPTAYMLYQNYPNPFNPTTTIKFDLPEKIHVKLLIFDVLGRKVKTILDEEMSRGKHTVSLDMSDFPSGVYFYRLEAGKFRDIRKMLFIK